MLADIFSEMDMKKIDVLHSKLTLEDSVILDESWRQKVHSYLASVRGIVQREEMDEILRGRILKVLNELASEIDRNRAPIRKFADAIVIMCEGISSGATTLQPAVKVLERVVGSLVRLKSSKPSPLQLPKPEDLGLPDDSPDLPQLSPPEDDVKF
jgi:cell division ATPase FtsA